MRLPDWPTVITIAAVVALAVALFTGNITDSVPLTVMSQRAGLVMNPDAMVKLLEVPVGRVASIEQRANGQAAIQLEMDPTQLARIPGNVVVDIVSNTVFGANTSAVGRVGLEPMTNGSEFRRSQHLRE